MMIIFTLKRIICMMNNNMLIKTKWSSWTIHDLLLLQPILICNLKSIGKITSLRRETYACFGFQSIKILSMHRFRHIPLGYVFLRYIVDLTIRVLVEIEKPSDFRWIKRTPIHGHNSLAGTRV